MHEVLHSPGQLLDAGTRAFMEPRFGRDFSQVRVHAGIEPAASAQAVRARAYTVGRDIVFGAGQYAPGTSVGQRLVAHELTHVVQNGAVGPLGTSAGRGALAVASELGAESIAQEVAGKFAPFPVIARMPPDQPRLARASYNVGALTIQIDYGNIVAIPEADYVSAVETRFVNWAGGLATAIHPALTALTSSQRQWVLFGLDILVDNTTPAHSMFNRAQAVQRLIAQAPSSSTRPLGTANFQDFANEVLRVSGWFEVALAARLTAPTGPGLTALQTIYNPPPGPSAPPGGVLDAARLNAELPPALTTFLNQIDPANWASVGTQALATLGTIGNRIQAEARTFFAPYADTAILNQFSGGWVYSANLISTTATAPSQAERLSYLANRAEIVGRRDRPGGSIFSNCNFNSGRAADDAALTSIVTTMEANAGVRAIVNRLIQQTAHTDPTTKQVAVATRYNAGSFTECQARWLSIRSLSHELVHVLVHPSFPPKATSIQFGQIIREGFTEVLGVQLYDSLRAKAAANAAFKAQMEAGVTGAPCPPPSATTIRYGDAGPSAERIRNRVGNDNFRAAYFLGAVNLVGL